MVQQQLPENHSHRLPRESLLQGAQPEVIEVSMETYGHDGHIARVAPVDALLLRDQLMGEISPRKQAAVQGDVGQPGEALHRLLQHGPPHSGTAARR